jgi:hypothetical protein
MAVSAAGRTLGVVKWVLVMLTAGLLSVPSAADAQLRPVNEGGDYMPCITPAEYEAVHLNMPRQRAERIIDSRGSRHIPSDSLHGLVDYAGAHLRHGDIYRAFQQCDDVDMVVLEFKRDSPRQRVFLKATGLAPQP